ncbi:hypothetical protein FXF53_14050 [Micromonospora sp. WP24]|uniref:hypothetical protein n=1 Tax=unclassified Micromonospora TaxID=2617518 RepID=UPI0010524BE4|nr:MULTISPECIES: hypothetical protein [unclassified Micromonospora]TDC40390.1 hypothetical protein E1211_01105 [Micromonospora sp. 15K316]TYC00292.1 hypothetical protein FXF53_14050 [Micromonospora sp. WP24]
MLVIRLYDIETGHVQTLTEVADVASADRWLEQFAGGGIGTNDVVYVVEDAPRVAALHLREPEAGMAV